MLLIDIRSTNASAAEFISYRLKLYLAGRHHHHYLAGRDTTTTSYVGHVNHPLISCFSLAGVRRHTDRHSILCP